MDFAARAFADAWYRAWNAHDLDAILSHYAEDAELTSPIAARRGYADGRVRGKEDLRAYFAAGLARAPALRFEPIDVLVGPGGLTLYYAGVGGVRVAETMLLDGSGRVVRSVVHYASGTSSTGSMAGISA